MEQDTTTKHCLPLSNVRGVPQTAESCVPQHHAQNDAGCCNKTRLSKLKQVPDCLTKHPKNGHRYVSVSGKRLFDSRYVWPSDDHISPKRQQPGPKRKMPKKAKPGNEALKITPEIEVHLKRATSNATYILFLMAWESFLSLLSLVSISLSFSCSLSLDSFASLNVSLSLSLSSNC